jgi:hypothetical protein
VKKGGFAMPNFARYNDLARRERAFRNRLDEKISQRERQLKRLKVLRDSIAFEPHISVFLDTEFDKGVVR